MEILNSVVEMDIKKPKITITAILGIDLIRINRVYEPCKNMRTLPLILTY